MKFAEFFEQILGKQFGRIFLAGFAIAILKFFWEGISFLIWNLIHYPPMVKEPLHFFLFSPLNFLLSLLVYIILAFVFALLYKKLPGKGIWKGIWFGLCFWLIEYCFSILISLVTLSSHIFQPLSAEIYFILAHATFALLSGLVLALIYKE